MINLSLVKHQKNNELYDDNVAIIIYIYPI